MLLVLNRPSRPPRAFGVATRHQGYLPLHRRARRWLQRHALLPIRCHITNPVPAVTSLRQPRERSCQCGRSGPGGRSRREDDLERRLAVGGTEPRREDCWQALRARPPPAKPDAATIPAAVPACRAPRSGERGLAMMAAGLLKRCAKVSASKFGILSSVLEIPRGEERAIRRGFHSYKINCGRTG
jgi:hypothetical protein